MNIILKSLSFACAFFIVQCLFHYPLYAQEEDGEGSLLSPPILVVDIDGDGIDIIPLSESDVYFDMDGDGLVERTSWIAPSDGILSVSTLLPDGMKRKYTMLTRQASNMFDILKRVPPQDYELQGRTKKYIGIEPNTINEPKYPRPRMSVSIDGDSNSTLFDDVADSIYDDMDVGDSLVCKGVTLSYEQKDNMILDCYQRHKYSVKEVRLEYEDSNLPWNAYCKRYSFGHFDSFLSSVESGKYKEREVEFLMRYVNVIMCLNQGYRPEITDEFKEGRLKHRLEPALRRLEEYKPGLFSDIIK